MSEWGGLSLSTGECLKPVACTLSMFEVFESTTQPTCGSKRQLGWGLRSY